MPKDDVVRLRHMLEAARDAIGFAQGQERKDLERDRKLTLALIKSIEIVGEAASRLGPDTRSRYSQIPWADIVGMRNRLIHAYYDVDLDRVWDTVLDDLPPLVALLEEILPADPS